MEYIQSLIMAFSISFPNYLYTKLEEFQHIYITLKDSFGSLFQHSKIISNYVFT